MNLNDKSQSVISNLEDKINQTYKENIEKLNEKTKETIEKCIDLQSNSKQRFESYYNKKKIIDYLIYINLGITPIMFLILIYLQFLKK